ncbi:FixH family protein [Hoeflea sp.]|uniref:FixH family protein n=1 Tax=Hoeflea sp. TaxID=1940281 RepID=UPI003B013A1D
MTANRLVLAFCLLPFLTVAALACVSDPMAQRMTAETEGAPAVYAILDSPVISQPTGLELIICPWATGDVSNLAVDAWMPSHQHGMNYEPDIKAIGNGRYAVTNMVYHMPGLWQLTVAIQTGTAHATYVLDMPIR